MVKSLWFLMALLAFGPVMAQDDPKKAEEERRKQEEKKAEEEAKKVIAAYKGELAKAKNVGDRAAAIDNNLAGADAHPLIRGLLQSLLADPNPDIRAASIDALGNKKWKGDKDAAGLLLGCANNLKEEDMKVKCLRKFGNIAPYSYSVKMDTWFHHEKLNVCIEAVDACKEINSLRMMDKLIQLWAELDQIKEEKPNKGGGGSYGPAPPGVPASAGTNQQDEKLKRKKELMPKVTSAVNELWKKYDSTIKTNTYVEANKALQKHHSFFDKIIKQEDNEEKGIDPEEKKMDTGADEKKK